MNRGFELNRNHSSPTVVSGPAVSMPSAPPGPANPRTLRAIIGGEFRVTTQLDQRPFIRHARTNAAAQVRIERSFRQIAYPASETSVSRFGFAIGPRLSWLLAERRQG